MIKFINSKGGKATFFITGLVIIGAVLFIVITSSKLTASLRSPKIIFKEEAHDFGSVPRGPEIQYNFKFTNKGNATLRIEKVQTSCGCTGATVGEKLLEMVAKMRETAVPTEKRKRRNQSEF